MPLSTTSKTPNLDKTTDFPRPARKDGSKDDLEVENRLPVQPINFEPHEANSDLIRAKHKEVRMWPSHNFRQWTVHIPYNGKKLFEMTGRSGFDVFGYEIDGIHSKEGGSKRYSVMWDYQIGLVRMTQIFKACGFDVLASKVTFRLVHVVRLT
jgi:hypothetical protein